MSDGGVFCAGYHPARPYLLLRMLYLLLAGDLWLGMIEHGARYGMGGFNVAHFVWLDRLLPVPTPAFYVGLLIASGALSLVLALGRAPVALRLVLAGTYTLSWIVSIHDSYQHHYLLSWVLVWLAACPLPRGQDVRAGTRVRGWGLPMTAITCAIVYTFTGISKSESEWRSGYVLRSLSGSRPPGALRPGKLDAARDVFMSLGLDDATVWQLFSLGTIALQWTIALGYLASTMRDERPSRVRTLASSAGLVGALAFHAAAELLELFEIGMFSYYMMWIAVVMLGPLCLLTPIVGLIDGVGDRLARSFSVPETTGPSVSTWMAILSAVLLGSVGSLIPLPGASVALPCTALVVLSHTLLAGRDDPGRVRLTGARATALTALAVWVALTQTTVPFDYYRRGAGELSRMGQLEEALAMYRLAERFAPPGESRAARIRDLERQLTAPDSR